MSNKEYTTLYLSEYTVVNVSDKGYQVQFNEFEDKTIWIANDAIKSLGEDGMVVKTWILNLHVYE